MGVFKLQISSAAGDQGARSTLDGEDKVKEWDGEQYVLCLHVLLMLCRSVLPWVLHMGPISNGLHVVLKRERERARGLSVLREGFCWRYMYSLKSNRDGVRAQNTPQIESDHSES